jgi:hypothetical protein
MVPINTETRYTEALQPVANHDRIERHDGNSQTSGRLLQAVVKLNHSLGRSQLQNREERKGLRNDTLNLGTIGMHGWVVPQLTHPSMNGDDVVVAGDNIRRCDLVVPTLDKVEVGEDRDPMSTNVVIRGGEAHDIEPASAKSPGLSLAVALLGGEDGAARGSIVGVGLGGSV